MKTNTHTHTHIEYIWITLNLKVTSYCTGVFSSYFNQRESFFISVKIQRKKQKKKENKKKILFILLFLFLGFKDFMYTCLCCFVCRTIKTNTRLKTKKKKIKKKEKERENPNDNDNDNLWKYFKILMHEYLLWLHYFSFLFSWLTF